MDFFGFEGKKKAEENERAGGANIHNEEQDRLKQEKEEKKYENYNVAEKHEQDLNEKLGDENDNKRLENTLIKRIEYDMSQTKKQYRMKQEDKSEMEKMRRWKVKIYNIYITPLMEMLDAFLQITIGGSYQVQVFSNKKGNNYKVPVGKRGYADKTEVQQNCDKLERRPFDKIIDIEMRMSYAMVNNQKMMIELWDFNTIWMNTIKGYITLDLIDIVNGNCNVGFDITTKEKGKKHPSIYYLLIFSSLCKNRI